MLITTVEKIFYAFGTCIGACCTPASVLAFDCQQVPKSPKYLHENKPNINAIGEICRTIFMILVLHVARGKREELNLRD